MPHAATCNAWTSNSKTAIDGTGIWEWIDSEGKYEQRSKGFDPSFYTTMVNWKRNLDYYASVSGLPAGIFSFGHLGVYNCRHIGTGTTPSYHSWCRAFDLALVRFGTSTGPIVDLRQGAHASSQRFMRRRYLGVNAVCCRYFKNTLNGWTPDHANHIHVDNALTRGALDKTHAATVRFVQAALNNFNGESLTIDGVWGSLTTAAWNRGVSDLCFTPDAFTSSTGWAAWCGLIARHGFADKDLGFYKYGPC